MTIQQQAVAEIVRQFPTAGNLTLAKTLRLREPKLFHSVEQARTAVRAFKGAHGNRDRRLGRYKVEHIELRQAGEGSFAALPKPLEHFNDWQALKITGAQRVLVLSDLHIPYYDKDATVAALEYGERFDPTIILLNGDIADFYAVSHWQKDPRKRDFPNEIQAVRDFICVVRGTFPSARLIYKVGNHEERLENYMQVRAPELLGLPEFDFNNLFGLKEGELVTDKRPIQLGDLNVIHGHEYRFAISNPVNPARGFFLRCKAYALGGHFHQTSSHSARTVGDKNLGAWSTGCLCGLHPDYRPLNDWNHGFATVEVFEDGKFHVENKFISKGRVY